MKDFVDQQSDEDASEIVAAMREVSREGIHVARHLRGEIYEVRAEGQHEKGRILLSLEAFSKKTRQTPTRLIDIAERRLADWRSRGG